MNKHVSGYKYIHAMTQPCKQTPAYNLLIKTCMHDTTKTTSACNKIRTNRELTPRGKMAVQDVQVRSPELDEQDVEEQVMVSSPVQDLVQLGM